MRKKISPFIVIFVTSILSVFYFCINVNSWKFSFVGDEWSFYLKAVEIAKNNFFINPFSLDGVWGQNPVTISFYQAIFIKFLGANNFAWRLSTIILIVPLSIFLYLWIKKLFDWKVALISTLVMQTSFYLANFFKIGYPNPLSLTLFILIIYLTTIISSSFDNFKKVFLLGIILGISFYIYIGPIFPLMLGPYFIILFWNKYPIKKLFLPITIFLFAYFFLLIPFIIQVIGSSSYLSIVTEKTVLKKEYSDNLQPFYNFLANLVLFFRNNNYTNSHFVSGPYFDYLTQFFTLIGLVFTFINVKKNQNKLLLTLFVSIALVIGVTSPYPYTPITRGIFFLPLGFVFSGIGINLFLNKFFKTRYWVFFLVIFAAIFFVNLYHGQIGVFKVIPPNETTLIIKKLQEQKKTNNKKTTVLILPENSGYNYQNIDILRQAYELDNIEFLVKKTNNFTCGENKNFNIIIFKENENIINSLKTQGCTQNVLVI